MIGLDINEPLTGLEGIDIILLDPSEAYELLQTQPGYPCDQLASIRQSGNETPVMLATGQDLHTQPLREYCGLVLRDGETAYHFDGAVGFPRVIHGVKDVDGTPDYDPVIKKVQELLTGE
jgi:hypothetical protein